MLSNLHDYDLPSEGSQSPPAIPEPWVLDVKMPEIGTRSIKLSPDHSAETDALGPRPRNIDWAPDGRKLALIYEGRLFIAEGFDFKTKTAKSRMVADITVAKYKGKVTGAWLESPRWSPDGAKIAFVRPPDMLPAPGFQVCVLDVRTGSETLVAQDGFPPGIWGQPWSPDGASLVYAHSLSNPMTEPETMTMSAQGISTVRIDERKPVRIVESNMALSPSWSPKGDRLAYSAPPDYDGTVNFLQSVLVCDPDGKNSRPVAQYVPPKEEIDAAMVDVRKRLQRVLKEKYPNVFPDELIRQFDDNSISEETVGKIVMLAEIAQNARAIGGEEFERTVDERVKRFGARSNSGVDFDTLLSENFEDISLESSLPDEKREAILERLTSVIMDVLRPNFWLKARLDRLPTWSADGCKLAFVRWDMARGKMQLIDVNIATEQPRVLFDEDNIAGISWTRDGRAMVAVANRNLAYKGVSWDEARNWPEFMTMPSYPEIWLIEPK
jgi:Tol biopolymer transport system component